MICLRRPEGDFAFRRKLSVLTQLLTPDNVTPKRPFIYEEDNQLFIGVVNPVDDMWHKESSLALGHLLAPNSDWHQPMSPYPDGAYVLFRGNKTHLEVSSDELGSRSAWFFFTDDIFITSTSQRALVAFLGSFVPNQGAYPWVLSTGTLGPEISWDQRLQLIKGNSSVILDRANWKLTVQNREKAAFRPKHADHMHHRQRLGEELRSVFGKLNLDPHKWWLPLSGGVDSRAILMLLGQHPQLTCVTWGSASSLADKKTDAWVAKSVAEHVGAKHVFLTSDRSEEPLDRVLGRFLRAGEGRIDHVSGYMDGLTIWARLYEAGITGVIRGDECFGWVPAFHPRQVRMSVGLATLGDYENFPRSIRNEFPTQVLPESLHWSGQETLEVYRDRLYQQYRVPVVLAALTDIKLAYVEVANPLLSRAILNVVYDIPDALRTGKRLFRQFAKSISPDIPYATKGANADLQGLLVSQEFVDLCLQALGSPRAEELLPQGMLKYLREGLSRRDQPRSSRTSLVSRIKSLLPGAVKRVIGRFRPPTYSISLPTLAFRAWIIVEMDRLLNNDASTFQKD